MKDGIITREVVNREKHKKEEKKVQKTAAAEINDLMRAYHGLSPEQINILIMPYKAKAFAHHFISSRNMEETKTLEEIIQRRLLGTIPQEDFFEVLHKSSEEGGVGFDIRTAEKILRRVNRIIRTAYYIYQESRQRTDDQGRHIAISDEEKASKVTWYLLKTCYNKHYKNLDEVQVNRLRQAVKDRLTGALQKKDFYKVLDRPFKDNGVGLNRKTARAMSEELELILILGFGIVQKVSSAESRAAEKDIKKNIQNIRKSITADMPGAGLPPSGQASGFQPPPPPTAAVPAGQESKAEETAGSGSEPAGTAETEAPAAPDRQKEAGETTQEQAERVERMLKQALESHVANSQDGQAAGADQAGREEGGEEAAVAAGSGRGENIEKQE